VSRNKVPEEKDGHHNVFGNIRRLSQTPEGTMWAKEGLGTICVIQHASITWILVIYSSIEIDVA